LERLLQESAERVDAPGLDPHETQLRRLEDQVGVSAGVHGLVHCEITQEGDAIEECDVIGAAFARQPPDVRRGMVLVEHDRHAVEDDPVARPAQPAHLESRLQRRGDGQVDPGGHHTEVVGHRSGARHTGDGLGERDDLIRVQRIEDQVEATIGRERPAEPSCGGTARGQQDDPRRLRAVEHVDDGERALVQPVRVFDDEEGRTGLPGPGPLRAAGDEAAREGERVRVARSVPQSQCDGSGAVGFIRDGDALEVLDRPVADIRARAAEESGSVDPDRALDDDEGCVGPGQMGLEGFARRATHGSLRGRLRRCVRPGASGHARGTADCAAGRRRDERGDGHRGPRCTGDRFSC
jgi:hypothetical protein